MLMTGYDELVSVHNVPLTNKLTEVKEAADEMYQHATCT